MPPTTDQLVLVKCNGLEIGMYVAELDRSWLHTPFTSRGFLIATQAQLDDLRRCCDYVYVDPEHSDPAVRDQLLHASPPTDLITGPPRNQDSALHAINDARATLRRASTLVTHTIHDARRHGRIDIDIIYRDLAVFLDNSLHNIDAMQWLIATEPMQGFLSRRSLGTAVLCITFGRHLGLERHELMNLALGGMLLDIGKVAVPITILAKPHRLSKEEKWFTNRHVRESLSLLHFGTDSLDRVFSMIAAHHERLDGSGYPNQIGGTDIPLYARIAGIADTFDALTLNRHYATARSGYAALRFLSALRRTKFDSALVDEFIDGLGAYPTGTRVQLDDGSTGLVCWQNSGRPREPDVLLTNDAGGRPIKTFRVVTAGANSPIIRAFPTPQQVNPSNGDARSRSAEA